jgi:hypothetical protein
MKNTFLSVLISTVFISCENKKTKETDLLFSKAEGEIISTGYNVNIDSFKNIYIKLKNEDLDKAKTFVIRFDSLAKELKNKNQIFLDSFSKIKERKLKQIEKINEYKWWNSKAGKIQKRHPNWTNEDCNKLARKEIWIGMHLDMLKYLRGKPSSVNISNYGKGDQWQWCWDDYSPSCFYGDSNGVVNAYN